MGTFCNVLSPIFVILTLFLRLKVEFNGYESSVPTIPPLAPPSISAFILLFLLLFNVNFVAVPTISTSVLVFSSIINLILSVALFNTKSQSSSSLVVS